MRRSIPTARSDMANRKHLAMLKRGVKPWNAWREANPQIRPNLAGASLSKAKLSGANLYGAILFEADLSGANLYRAILFEANLAGTDLSGANLSGANLCEASLFGANLSRAKLAGTHLSSADLLQVILTDADLNSANLFKARLHQADLSRANLTNAYLAEADLTEADLLGACLDGADLTKSRFIGTHIKNASMRGCRVYGVSVWDVKGQPAEQRDLVITPHGEPKITVDNLKVAQFIYLLLNNPEIREVIDTITSKVVLILGRFTKERKPVLDALRDELRKRNKLPVLFDFTPCENRDTVETIRTLAGMAQFIIADITDAKSIIGELKDIVPNFPSVPVQPIVHVGDVEYGMFDHIKRFAWVLEPYQYEDSNSLLAALGPSIIEPAENKWKELRPPRPPGA